MVLACRQLGAACHAPRPMRLSAIHGIIDRRILVNYRVDADVAARLLPPPFRPKLARGFAIAGICLIRLKRIRPAAFPLAAGISSENAAHRFAVEWDQDGRLHAGVFIPRRDSNSRLNRLFGGRLVPGEHHHARFDVDETDARLRVALRSDDGQSMVMVLAHRAADLPAGSVFASLDEASRFFQAGALGYSATKDPARFDGIELQCKTWSMSPLAVEMVRSSYFDDVAKFPAGSATFDDALLMRGIEHQWLSRDSLCCGEPAGMQAAAAGKRPVM